MSLTSYRAAPSRATKQKRPPLGLPGSGLFQNCEWVLDCLRWLQSLATTYSSIA